MTHLCATAMTPRDFRPAHAAAPAFRDAIKKRASAHVQALDGWSRGTPAPAGETGVAFPVRLRALWHAANEDVYRCHVALSIPTNPGFGSLNLGAPSR
jgi:tRNA/rRNA methyltransferase